MTARTRRPRPPVITQPIMVTQLNCLPLVGIDARRFLELVRDRRIPHARSGKLVFVEVEVLRDVLFDSSVAPNGGDDDGGVADVDDDPQGVDDVLAVIGRQARR